MPAGDRVFDDLFGGVDVLKAFNGGGAGFFEVFVVVEMLFDLIEELFGEVGEGLDGIAGMAVVDGDGDDFVVNFAVVDKFHDADDTSGSVDAGGEGVVSEEEDVEFVAVLIEGLGDEAVVAGFGVNHGFDAVKHEAGAVAVPFDFLV